MVGTGMKKQKISDEMFLQYSQHELFSLLSRMQMLLIFQYQPIQERFFQIIMDRYFQSVSES